MGMKLKLFLLVFAIVYCSNVFAQKSPEISEIDRIRLAEAFRLKEKLSETVWKNWGKTPLAVLLVTPENEFLIRHPSPSKDFTKIGFDKKLKSDIFWRRRSFNPAFLATFPAIQGSGVSTIVVGQAENTWVKTSTPWVVTVLHEHFHQMQDSQPNFYQDALDLNISGGDQTGMWMLNYPFPYKDEKINEDFSRMAKQLAAALETQNETEFRKELAAYLETRKDFNSTLKENDYKYLSFQLWKEGTARYAEYLIAKAASEKYKPGKEFTKLKDYKPYAEIAGNLREQIIESLKTIQLEKLGREVVYPYGAAEAMLLDKAKIEWKLRYFNEKFYPDKYFELK